MPLDISLWKINTGQKRLSFLGSKIWSGKTLVTKMLNVFFCACFKENYLTSSANNSQFKELPCYDDD